MSSEHQDVAARNDGRPPKFCWPVLRRLLSVLAGIALWGALLFVSAGRLDWTRAWVYLGAFVLCFAANALTLQRYFCTAEHAEVAEATTYASCSARRQVAARTRLRGLSQRSRRPPR